MGMFDYVHCELPLPDGKPGAVFQTKNFDCLCLGKYTIRADGRLIHDTPHGQIDTNFHGILNFYDYNCETSEWREFNAKFTDGQLVGIEHVPDEST